MVKKITIAAPVYNEFINIDKFVSELFDTIKPLSSIYDFRVLLINDGSDDGRNDENPNRELFEAMKLVAETGAGPERQIPSMGCSIKWGLDKPGE